MVDVDKLTKDTINNGGLLSLLYFDLHGKNKEVLQQLAASFVDNVLKQKGVVTALGDINEPLEREDLYSTSIELKVLTKDFSALVNLCALFSPINVEILRPSEVKLSLDKAHELLVNIATEWFDIKRFITERVANEKDREQLKKYLENRLAVGKKILEEKNEHK